MPGVKQCSRVDILEIKIQVVKKLGKQKAEKYFNLLNNFFTLKIGKPEFNKLCIAIIGKENIRIHNLLIQSILKNVCIAKIPPPPRRKYKVDKVDVIDGKVVKPNSVGPIGNKLTILEQRSAVELVTLGSRPPPVEVISVEDGEEVDQGVVSPGVQSRGQIISLLGVQWNGKEYRKKKIGSLLSCSDCVRKGGLPDTSDLWKRMEVKLRKEGLGVSLECANLVNCSLDVFLKRLIKSSLELPCSRVGNYQQRNQVNGLVDSVPVCASMLDFRTAMELNPQMLGEDWPLLLEKVSLREFENWD